MNWRSNAKEIEKIDLDVSASEKIHVNGTPTFIINGKMYTGIRNFEEFKEILTIEE